MGNFLALQNTERLLYKKAFFQQNEVSLVILIVSFISHYQVFINNLLQNV